MIGRFSISPWGRVNMSRKKEDAAARMQLWTQNSLWSIVLKTISASGKSNWWPKGDMGWDGEQWAQLYMYTYREETLQDTKKVRTYQAVQTILSAPLQTPFTTGTVSLCSCSSVFSHDCLSSNSVAGILTASYDALLSGRDRLRLRCFQSGGSPRDIEHHATCVWTGWPILISILLSLFQIVATCKIRSRCTLFRTSSNIVWPRVIQSEKRLRARWRLCLSSVNSYVNASTHKSTQISQSSTSTFCILKYA